MPTPGDARNIKYAVYSEDTNGERVLRACDLPSEQAAKEWIGRLLTGMHSNPPKMHYWHFSYRQGDLQGVCDLIKIRR